MKRLVAFTALLAACFTSTALAAGINLSWNDCGVYGATNRSFACNSNTLTGAVLVGSYVPPAGTTAITGNEIVIDLVSAGSTLPAWWQFKNFGSCRQTSLSSSADFTSGPFSCADYWSGLAAGGLAAYLTPYMTMPSRARILLIYAVAVENARPMDETVEYYSFKLTINGAKTVGSPSCSGCVDPVCLVLSQIKITQPAGVGDYRLQSPLDHQFATWQGGVVIGGCPGATPTRNTTWGSLKSQYR
ncbi:MAG: hypothetical protein HZA61_15795 [Candidatus Eisenbacteria bacterium]|uniref:Uncharacterized protein n=1 Tax=Eiseniibacteriota bacterium TaxID=2212470 RepID=A0A933W4E4_UNCEI|nr:hypothetical protein [Candidatus Eisenbacteria bacterium]